MKLRSEYRIILPEKSPIFDIWYEASRKAAVTRMIKADAPLEGIYYWYPTPKSWEMMTWYLDDEPGESAQQRQMRFNRIQHMNVYPQILGIMIDRWGIPDKMLEGIRNHYDAFPRGRVYQNLIARGECEKIRIPHAHERVCRIFNRDLDKINVLEEEHWDASPNTLPKVEKLLEELQLPGFQRSKIRVRLSLQSEVDDKTRDFLEELASKEQIAPRIYDIPTPNGLRVDHDGQIFVRKIFQIRQLKLSDEAEPNAVEEAAREIAQKTPNYPVVHLENDEAVVTQNEARVRAAEQQGLDRVYAWLFLGYFNAEDGA